MTTLGLLYGDEVLVPGPEGLILRPLAAVAAEVGAAPIRLACVSETALEQLLPKTAGPSEIEAAFEPGFLLAYEVLPEGVQVFALEEAFVRRLFQVLPGLELLTSYPVVLRQALQPAPDRLVVVVEGLGRTVWLHALRGGVALKRRVLDRAALLRDVQQSLGAIRFDPLKDRLLATPAEAEALRPTLEAEPFARDGLLDALARLDPKQTIRFAPPERLAQERARAGAARRRLVLAGLLVLLAGGAFVGIYTWARREQAEGARRGFQDRMAQLQGRVQALLRPRYPALLKRQQPDWPLVFEELSRALPRELQLTSLSLRQTGPFRWTLQASGEAGLLVDPLQAMQAIDRLRLNLAETQLWRGAEVAVTQGKAGVGVQLTATW